LERHQLNSKNFERKLFHYVLIAAIGAAFFLPADVCAINAEYIAAKIQDSTDCSAIVHDLTDVVEKQMPLPSRPRMTSEKRDTLICALRQAYVSLLTIEKKNHSLKAKVLTGLVLLYLEQLKFPGSVPLAQTTLTTASKQFPLTQELVWLFGLHCMSCGKVFKGIRILEDLRISGFNREEFLADYARSVFYSFIHSNSDSVDFLVKTNNELTGTDTVHPVIFSWKIINSRRAELPFFDYQTAFSFRKPFTLVFSMGRKDTDPKRRALLSYKNLEPQSDISVNLTGQLSDRKENAWCTVHIDVNDVNISPYEYLVKRISGIYDSIEVKSDLSQFRAISLRCYNRDFFGMREGSYSAYIVFDRNETDIFRDSPTALKSLPLSPTKNIRFTLTMRCAREVKDAAEAKLQSIIHAF
jgi:hypothetical protein